jgi:hypothetical protein
LLFFGGIILKRKVIAPPPQMQVDAGVLSFLV